MIDFQTADGFLGILGLVFSAGFLSGLSPCTLPTAVLVVGFVSGKKENSKLSGFILSLCFALGMIVTLSLLGFFVSFAGSLLNTKILNYALSVILILMALWMLKIFDFSSSKKSLASVNVKKGSGFLGAFLLGLPFGIAASPCTLPVTASLLAYSATLSVFYGLVLMLFFAIGKSIPLVLIGTFTSLIKHLKKVEKFQVVFQKVGGVILLGLGLYYLIF